MILCKCGCGKEILPQKTIRKDRPSSGFKVGHWCRSEEYRKRKSDAQKYTLQDIWKQIDIKRKDECWNWLGHKDKDGYGRATINSKDYRSHRVVYEETYGKIIGGLFVLHTCNNPSCCNPNHLYLGTNQDNMNQMVREKRSSIKITTPKLTEKNVIDIRKLYSTGNYTQYKLAEIFKIGQGNISEIVNKKHWAYI